MHGTMRWFNATKDLGAILTEDGEPIPVSGNDFAGGQRPEGRCAGQAVVFDLAGRASDVRAENVRFVQVAPGGRARARRSSFRMR